MIRDDVVVVVPQEVVAAGRGHGRRGRRRGRFRWGCPGRIQLVQLLSPALLGLSTATGDIPAPDERVVAAARAVLGAEWDAAEFQLCYDQLFINGKCRECEWWW